VGKYFGRTTVIKELSLSIQNGEFVTLLGPSGCGKSTTLNMIAGLEFCTTGKVYFDKEDVTYLPPGKRDIAMVFQSYALYPHLTVFDNIAFPLAARNIPKLEIQDRVEKAAAKLGLSMLMARYPRELSGGQRQRVALGRAIVRTPKVFLFDEPLSNLDASLKVLTRSEIKKLHQELEATMIYVTHDQAEAMSLSDRIAILQGGKLQQFDTPDNVYNHPANIFVATFIGSPAMNLWKGEAGENKALKVGNCHLSLPESLSHLKPGEKVTLGIRPHQFTVAHTPSADSICAEVITSQPMGECNFLDLRLGIERAIVRTEPTFATRVGEKLHLSYDKNLVHYFDQEGLRLQNN
jgi:multiple sugar transport system ATP-binding protein